MNCTICGTGTLVEAAEFGRLPRVTSDCRPWPPGGRIGCCDACGAVQKPVDEDFRDELSQIYSDYVMYAQSGGTEQRSLGASGTLDPRSVQIVDAFVRENALPERGSWLDIGCGNGATLRAVARAFPTWRLVGTELDDRNKATIEAIPGVDRAHCGPLDTLDDAFDVISLVHVFEHVEEPSAFLESLKRLLRPNGLVLIESPYWLGNAFDLAIADHVTHFDGTSLRRCFERAGLHFENGGLRFLDRELYAIARLNGSVTNAAPIGKSSGQQLRRHIAWLNDVADTLARLNGGSVGVFGSSIGATFAYGAREGNIEFFLDEDPDRIGRSHLGIRIFAPDDAAVSGTIFVALPPRLAAVVTAKPARGRWIVPGPYQGEKANLYA